MMELNRFVIFVGYIAVSGVLAYGLWKKWPRPSKRPVWYMGLSIVVFWTLFYGTTAFVSVGQSWRVVLSELGHALQLGHIATVLYIAGKDNGWIRKR